MTNCMVISLYLWQQQVAVRCQELPPLCLPQQLLPGLRAEDAAELCRIGTGRLARR